MIFDKSTNTPVFSAVTGPGFNIGQSIYTLPDTTTKIWHENRDGLHANYEQYFDNLIRKGDSTSWGINSSEKYMNGIVISNSSTAANASEASGSNTRYLDIANQTLYHAIRDSWRQGCLQFFPEHQDFDAVDWFRVNQPYVFTSQGSSGSEGEEVQRCNDIVKALKPDVREWMIANQRVGDVVAYLMRSNMPGGYLDPKNHQPVLSTKWPAAEDFALAASLTIDTMPPKLSIKLIGDSYEQSDRVRTDEVIGLKRVDLTQTRVIEVELICDKANVHFYWLGLQGVSTIERNTKYRATITIPFQSEFEIEAQDGHRLLSNRTDIIAVAHDGNNFSCPVFISEYTTLEARALMPIPDLFEGKNVVKQIVKEGEWIRLKAPVGFLLGDVLFASYGTSTNYVRGACHSSASMNLVAAAKTAKSLDVQGSYLVFGDPCYGVNKTLAVAVELVPEVLPVPTPAPAPAPDQLSEITQLKAQLELAKQAFSSMNNLYVETKTELDAMTIERNISIQNEKDTQHKLEIERELAERHLNRLNYLNDLYVETKTSLENLRSQRNALRTALMEILK